jgi:hypothetical protein
MISKSSVIAYAAIALLGLSAAGCGQQPAANNSSTSTSTTTTTTTTETNAAAPTGDATSTSTTTTAAASNLPASCQAYLTAVQACVDRLSSSNPAVATQFRQTMETTRQQWSAISDQAALGQACTTAQNAFTQSSRAMGC